MSNDFVRSKFTERSGSLLLALVSAVAGAGSAEAAPAARSEFVYFVETNTFTPDAGASAETGRYALTASFGKIALQQFYDGAGWLSCEVDRPTGKVYFLLLRQLEAGPVEGRIDVDGPGYVDSLSVFEWGKTLASMFAEVSYQGKDSAISVFLGMKRDWQALPAAKREGAEHYRLHLDDFNDDPVVVPGARGTRAGAFVCEATLEYPH